MTVNLQAQQFNYLWSKQQLPDIEILDTPNFKDFQLDYSLQSLERVDLYIDTWRQLGLLTEQQIIDSPILLNTLNCLAFYCAEVIGRTKNCHPLWVRVNGSNICSYPDDKHSLEMTDLAGVLSSRLLYDEKSIVSVSEVMINLVYKQEDKYSKPLPIIHRQNRNFAQRLESLSVQQRQNLYTSMPDSFAQFLGLQDFLKNMPVLFQQGYFVRGTYIRADNDLFNPKYVHGRFADIIYDSEDRLTYDDLCEISQRIQSLANQSGLTKDQRMIKNYLQAGKKQLFNADISDVVGFPIMLSTIFVDQNHLPDGMLSSQRLPLVIYPERFQYVTILPYFFWSDLFKLSWLEQCQQRLGQMYDIESLKEQQQQQAEYNRQNREVLQQQSDQEAAKLGIIIHRHNEAQSRVREQPERPKSKKKPSNSLNSVLGWVALVIFGIIIIKIIFRWLFG